MQKFKVGNRVKIKKSVSAGYYEGGAEGVVLSVNSDLFVKFDKGTYDTDCDGEWFVNFSDAEVVKEKKMKAKKSEGDGYIVTNGWAVEVNGKLYPSLVFGTREEAREFRNLNAEMGHKAHVRRTEVKVLKHKV